MKKLNLLSMFLSAAAITALIFVSACTKEGPQGPPGEDGIDGNATCGTCHDNSETVETVIGQWNFSIHATGGHNFENRTTCAPCHTSQGFKEALAIDSTATRAAIENPANINCYTCHQIHDTYSASDWALRVSGPSPSWLTGQTHDFGTANLCVKCHQPRISYQVPDVTNPEGSYEVTSSRFGPHYGPQSAVITGDAFYLVGSGYMNSAHTNIANSCIECHMASAVGYVTGGHSWNMENEEEGYNFNGCLECHTADEAEELTVALQAEVTASMDELKALLEAAGIYNPATDLAKTGTYTNKVAGAYWNWKSVQSDHSLGVHNPKFVKKILENSIASLQ